MIVKSPQAFRVKHNTWQIISHTKYDIFIITENISFNQMIQFSSAIYFYIF